MIVDPPPPYPTVFACVLLSSTDKIRLWGFSQETIHAINTAIQQSWPKGIQRHGEFEGTWEWKMSGHPWSCLGSDTIYSRRLVISLLRTLSSQGWVLHGASDMMMKGVNKDTLFFRAAPPVERVFFSISFNDGDKIRLINSPSDAVTNAFQAAVQTWTKGIQESRDREAGCFQIKLNGHPWYTSDGAHVVSSKIMACNILSAMDNQGFELVGSIHINYGTAETSMNADTWFLASNLKAPVSEKA